MAYAIITVCAPATKSLPHCYCSITTTTPTTEHSRPGHLTAHTLRDSKNINTLNSENLLNQIIAILQIITETVLV